MRYLSLFSGIEAASVAWIPLGWECVGVAEIEKFPCAVLAHHYPGVPNLGDITKITQEQIAALGHIDLVVGGFPCQDVSVAGKRAGLTNDNDGSATRSGLFFTAMRVVGWAGARWTVIENVPGLFSSKQGADFASVVGALAGCEFGIPDKGWGKIGAAAGPDGMVEWCVLDAQWFGVPQRRRRVFLARDTGDWHSRPPVLFERHSLQGHPPPSREARQGVAGTVAPCIRAGGNRTGGDRPPGSDVDTADSLQVIHCADATTTHQAKGGDPTTDNYVAHSLRGGGFDASEDGTGRGTPLVPIAFDTTQITSAANYSNPQPGDACHPIAAGAHPPAVAYGFQPRIARNGRGDMGDVVNALNAQSGETGKGDAAPCVAVAHSIRLANTSSNGWGVQEEVTHTLDSTQGPAVQQAMQVRRLTPRECERLQGFPSIRERVTVEACTDHQNNTVTVALSCLRWPSNASPVDAQRYPQNANIAENISCMHRADREPLAALSVRTSSADLLHEIRSHGKLMWSASSVAESNKYPPSTQVAGIAAALAPHLRDLALAIRTGKAESLQNIRLSTQARDGAKNVTQFGNENAAFASGATNAASLGKLTTSTLGSLAPICGSPVATSLCSVLAAINGCIPNETLPERFSLEFDLETPYTLVPFTHGKPAADVPRYKALGNSMAVPVMRWIGERIQLVDWLHGND